MKSSKVIILTYHYVRDFKKSLFPIIDGLELDKFIEQISFLKKYYTIISMDTLLDSINSSNPLPSNSVLLTFDDGYSDHYDYVLPLLIKNNIFGSFYIPFKAINENIVLDVNKIQLVLSVLNNPDFIIQKIFNEMNKFKTNYNFHSHDYYYKKLEKKNRWNTRKVLFIKRLLQTDLPKIVRKEILNILFQRYVTKDEAGLSEQYYMTYNNLLSIKNDGMHIGNHTYNHEWLGSKSKMDQENDFDMSMTCLNKINGVNSKWTVSYPYGNYNNDTIDILNKKGCSLGFTTNVGIADLLNDELYELPRLDTNDFPNDLNAIKNLYYNDV